MMLYDLLQIIIPYGYFTLRILYPTGIIPYGHFTLWVLYPTGIIPYRHFTLRVLYPKETVPQMCTPRRHLPHPILVQLSLAFIILIIIILLINIIHRSANGYGYN